NLKSQLTNIYCADTLEDALLQRHQLSATESTITPEGIWLGKHWLRLPRKQDASGNILQRQKEIRQLQQQAEELESHLATKTEQVDTLRENISLLQSQHQQIQEEANRLYREESATNSQLDGLQQRIHQLSSRQQQITRDQEEINLTLECLQQEHEQATEQRNIALALMEELEESREQLAQDKDEHQYARDNARSETRERQEALHQLKLDIETCRNQFTNSQRQLERVNSQLQMLEQQRDELLLQITEQETPNEDLQEQLTLALETRASIELRLSEARQRVQTLDNETRSKDSERVLAERTAETMRDQQEELKLEWQAIQVRLQTLQEQFTQTEFDSGTLLNELEQSTNKDTTETFQQQLAGIQRNIQRLGAINLAAIEEFQEQSERKTWLDAQNEDLETALETLESAMRKIDRETRTRFRETFDHVNGRLKAMFPRLFGGGECYLEMTGDDLLTTGVAIMARPPGKRISSIHLMSGGEKALTAVALVFAIFELNPAPFCMLDEVDAPLDEANVGRFCDLVGDMAERVQFIFITHNKRTMELADNLIGVTMREPGVSRLVTVDMAEAVQLAEI
ncbi:MAG: chromosome segregation protein SMC, partial [Thiolinea sp.]